VKEKEKIKKNTEKKLKQAARYEMMISKEDHSLSCDQNEKITSFCKSKNSFLKTHIIGITNMQTLSL